MCPSRITWCPWGACDLACGELDQRVTLVIQCLCGLTLALFRAKMVTPFPQREQKPPTGNLQAKYGPTWHSGAGTVNVNLSFGLTAYTGHPVNLIQLKDQRTV